ncbi:MAG TPA: glycoside hydrolase family 3 N-terminal domain-containing protein, partial [Nitrospiraceae bacterium]
SPTIITQLLRQELRYDGVVFTDDLEMHAIIDHYGVEDAAVRAILAGCDVVLICKDREREIAAFRAVEQAVASGVIPTERLDQSVERISRVKKRFLYPYRPPLISEARLVVGCRTHQALLTSIHQTRGRFDPASAVL